MTTLLEKIQGLVDAKLVRKARHPTLDLSIYNYTEKAQFKNLWTEETKMCRGLVLNDAGVVVARPFKKFFNLKQTQLHKAHTLFEAGESYKIYDKLDGSLGIYFYYEGEWVFASRGSFTSPQSQKGAQLVQQYRPNFDSQYTYIFEIIYAENRIVIDYGSEEKLVLLGAVNTQSDKYEELDIDHVAEALWMESAKDYKDDDEVGPIDKLEDLYHVKHTNREGFVVRFQCGERVKIKFDDYIEMHRIRTGFKHAKVYDTLALGKTVLDIVDMIPDEYHAVVKELETKALEDYDAIVDAMNKVVQSFGEKKMQGSTMKELAGLASSVALPEPFRAGDLMKAVALGIQSHTA
jgi:RNA ligase